MIRRLLRRYPTSEAARHGLVVVQQLIPRLPRSVLVGAMESGMYPLSFFDVDEGPTAETPATTAPVEAGP